MDMSVQRLVAARGRQGEEDIDRPVLCIGKSHQRQMSLGICLRRRRLPQRPRIAAALDGKGLSFVRHLQLSTGFITKTHASRKWVRSEDAMFAARSFSSSDD